MEAAVAAPRPWLFLLVLAAAAAMTLVPGATGERRGWRAAAAGRAGGGGARGPGPASGSLLLFLKHGAGPGAQVAAPGQGPGFAGRAAATRAARAEREGGAGACVRARVDEPGGRPRSRPRVGGGVSGPSEMGGCPPGSERARAEGGEAGLRPRHPTRSGAREAPGAGSGSESPGFPRGE